MAFKGRERPSVDFANLIVSLNKTKLQQTNQPLYQVIKDLIDKAQQSTGQINSTIQSIVGRVTITDDLNLASILISISTINAILQTSTFLVTLDESNSLPNSRRLLAGVGIAFDDTVPNERTISSTGGAGTVMYVPLTDGNIDETQLIFAAGECIMIPVLI